MVIFNCMWKPRMIAYPAASADLRNERPRLD